MDGNKKRHLQNHDNLSLLTGIDPKFQGVPDTVCPDLWYDFCDLSRSKHLRTKVFPTKTPYFQTWYLYVPDISEVRTWTKIELCAARDGHQYQATIHFEKYLHSEKTYSEGDSEQSLAKGPCLGVDATALSKIILLIVFQVQT